MGPEAGRVRLPRPGGHGPHGLRVVVDGGVRVSAAQRERLLDATLTAVDELGYRQTTVRMIARRAFVLQELTETIDAGRAGYEAPHELSPLTAEGMIGAAFSLIHARLCEPRSAGSPVDLLNPLMAMIVLPYRGRAAAARELGRLTVAGNRPVISGAGQ